MASQVDQKWFRDHLADKEISANGFAELIGIHRSTLSKMLNGRYEMSAEVITAFANHFGESYETVARHAGLPMPKVSHRGVRVVGVVDRRGKIEKVRGMPAVERPPNAGDEVVALAMPGFYDWVIYYTPAKRIDQSAFGRWAVCELDSGVRYVRVLERGKLKAICGSDVIEGRVVSAAPVLYVKTL